jgi:hypothetical protein
VLVAAKVTLGFLAAVVAVPAVVAVERPSWAFPCVNLSGTHEAA